ncbi:MAG: HD-GYP domain-containing protein [Thermoleophilia bacterium]|nr:HD-GYP domain-containing protein [Thermoleophilia bacterium]
MSADPTELIDAQLLAAVRRACSDCSHTSATADEIASGLPAILTSQLPFVHAVLIAGPNGSAEGLDPSKLVGVMSTPARLTPSQLRGPGRARWASLVSDTDATALFVIPMWTETSLGRYVSAWVVASAAEHQQRGFLDALTIVVNHAATVISARHMSLELESSRVAALSALATALEATDQYTYDHARDVAKWAVGVGERLGLEPHALRDLELAAIFHDIGKIAIPSEILNKPGKLTDAEFEVMKTHTIIGESIIAPLGMREVHPVVRHEHERWDGAGYPDGISGGDIPLGSRIIFVCDAYHAITSDRPYRAAQSHHVAREILEDNAGSQFDPAVVQIFLELLDEQLCYEPRLVSSDDVHRAGEAAA